MRWSLKPLFLQELAVVQPERIGGHSVLQVARLQTNTPLTSLLTGEQLPLCRAESCINVRCSDRLLAQVSRRK